VRIEVRPAFDEAVLAAEFPLRTAAAKMLRLLSSLDLPQLWSHPGLHFEKLHGMIEPAGNEQLYSLRLSSAARAIACLRQGPILALISLHVQQDKAYRK
jgi:hypothetical protein